MLLKVASTKGNIFFVTNMEGIGETYGFSLRGREIVPVTGDAHGFEYEAVKDAIEEYKASCS